VGFQLKRRVAGLTEFIVEHMAIQSDGHATRDEEFDTTPLAQKLARRAIPERAHKPFPSIGGFRGIGSCNRQMGLVT
jgi:hypothetical protein